MHGLINFLIVLLMMAGAVIVVALILYAFWKRG